MSIMLLGNYFHPRKDKFGKLQQSMEKSFTHYLNNLYLSAEGFTTPIKRFTTKKTGIVSTEMIKELVEKQLEYKTCFSDAKEKEFYSSFLYCAYTFFSLDFTYLYHYDKSWIPTYKAVFSNRCAITFFNVLESSRVKAYDDGTFGLVDDTSYSGGFEHLYELLADEYIHIPTFSYTSEQLDEILDATQLESCENLDDLDESDPFFWEDQQTVDSDTDDLMTEAETHEANILEGKKIMLTYPGYSDYIEKLKQFIKLFPQYAKPSFNEDIREMISGFLLANGYSIFDCEEGYIDMMVSIKKAQQTLNRYMD